MRANFLHLNAGLRLKIAGEILAFLHGVTLIAFFIGALELHVGRWSGSSQNSDPISEDVTLGKRSMTILLLKFVGIEILPGRLTATHQEKMISPQRGGIWKSDNAVNKHGKRHPPLGDGSSK